MGLQMRKETKLVNDTHFCTMNISCYSTGHSHTECTTYSDQLDYRCEMDEFGSDRHSFHSSHAQLSYGGIHFLL